MVKANVPCLATINIFSELKLLLLRKVFNLLFFEFLLAAKIRFFFNKTLFDITATAIKNINITFTNLAKHNMR